MSKASGGPTVWQMVIDAVNALGGSTTNEAVRRWIWAKYPDTNRSTINCQLIAGCVNHPSRVHYGIDARPRPANVMEIDRFFRPARGAIETYNPARHGKWEIFATSDGKLSVRETSAWPAATAKPAEETVRKSVPADPSVPTSTRRSIARGEARGGEMGWAAGLQPRLEEALQTLSSGGIRVRVDAGWRLPYACEVASYCGDRPEMKPAACYETDLLIYDDDASAGRWLPRVVVECKLGAVTTHDALTYSAKAATHKQVHPYLRYGILIGGYGSAVPSRLVRHGSHFDFMAVWGVNNPSDSEWTGLLDVLRQEVEASRTLERLLSGRAKDRRAFQILHRPLNLR